MKLRDFQIPSRDRLVSAVRTHGAGVDASDTGVGKTHVACAACKELGLRPRDGEAERGLRPRDGFAERGLRPAVVCPKNLVSVWRKACRDWGLPDPVFVTNYEALRTGRTEFLLWSARGRAKRAVWSLPAGTILIFDEVHRCAGRGTLNAEMLAAARRYGIPVIGLSTTAAESPLKLNALGFVLRLHDGGDSFWRFCRENGCVKNYWGGIEFPKGYARPGSRRAYQIACAQECLRGLHHQIFSSNGCPARGTRVRIAELGDAFPETLVTAEAYDFGDGLAAVYEACGVSGIECRLDDGNARPAFAQEATARSTPESALTRMLRARQDAELLKVPGLAEMARDAVEEGQSVVIFVNFRATLAALRKLLPDLPVIEGETPMDERTRILKAFGADEVRVVAANLATAGEGLDGLQDLRGEYPRLTLISPGFNAVQLKQALGRVHRANARSKSVQRIVFAAGTVEERACAAVQAKLQNIALLNDGDLAAGIVTTEATKGAEVSHA